MKITGKAEDKVLQFLEAWASGPGEVAPLKGDASTRRYYRLSGFDSGTAVLMYCGRPFGEQERAMLGIQRFLRALGVPVPDVLEAFPEKGMLLLEDLGDISLREFLNANFGADRLKNLRESLEILFLMQKEGTAKLGPDCPAFFVRFDGEIFFRELKFFHVNFLAVVAEVPADTEEALHKFYREVAEELAGYSNVFCHRDYHVDNLFYHKGKVYVIDFQDARIGPPAYDLVSLLTDRDMRGMLGDESLGALVDQYVEGMAFNREVFEHQYALAAVQRCLKATGTFGFQCFSRGNQSYGRFIAPTLMEFAREVGKLKRYAHMGNRILDLVPDKWKK